jgi:aminoglycoside phosphotransferase (APT) family kinase protein
MSILGGAFFIMEYIPGQPLFYASLETVPKILGKTHAELHRIDPKPLMKALNDIGVSEYRYSLDSRYDWLKNKADKFPWVKEGVNWLLENRPPEPDQLAVCHGDFHALNILVQDGEVTAVLDWPGFAITDPVYDVANAIVLTTIPARYLTATMEGFLSVDWDLVAESYLTAYRKQKNLDITNISYYRVNRCVMALIQGFEGQKIWQHPMVVDDLIGYIRKTADVMINVPV